MNAVVWIVMSLCTGPAHWWQGSDCDRGLLSAMQTTYPSAQACWDAIPDLTGSNTLRVICVEARKAP